MGDKIPDAFLGVAYIIKSPAIEMVEPWTIQNWPGNGAGKADKVGVFWIVSIVSVHVFADRSTGPHCD